MGTNAFETTWTAIPSSGASTTSYTVTGLTNGTAYQFKVRAVNSVGTGAESPASTAVTPATTPPAPTTLTGSAGNARVALTWTSGGDGGSAITQWQYVKKVGTNAFETTWTAIPNSGASTTSYTVTGLTNGTAYQFKVRAVNSVGTGAASPASAAVTPATTPPAPMKPTVTGGNASVALTWTSGGDGGSAITQWQYVKKVGANNFETTWTAIPSSGASTTSYTVTGLTNGTAYQFKVRAVNSVGTGAASSASAAVTPATTPPAPTTLTGSAGNARVALTWTSGGDGGSAITQWQYVKKVGASNFETTWSAIPSSGATTTSYTVTGLTNGTAYQFKVRAVNSVGTGAESPASDAVTPVGSVALAASAVTETTATLTLANHTAAWWYQGDQGGAQCTSVAQNTTTASLTGLTGGTTYTYKAYSNDTCATELTSDSTDAEFTTVGLTAGSVTPTGATLMLANWTAAWWHNKTAGPGTASCTSVAATTTTATLTGLTGGSSYTWTVYSAANCNAADKVADVDFTTTQPAATAPLAPSKPGVTGGNARVTLTWTSGGNGGSAITQWQYVKKVGTNAFETTWTAIPSSGASTTSYTVTGLTNGTAYQFKVRAVNSVGIGAESPASDAVTPVTTPPAPTKPTVTAGNASVALTWTSNGDGGSAITKWQYVKKVRDQQFRDHLDRDPQQWREHHQLHGDGPDEWDRVPVQGTRGEQRGHRRGIAGLELRDACGVRDADRERGSAGNDHVALTLDPPAGTTPRPSRSGNTRATRRTPPAPRSPPPSRRPP